VFFSTESKGDAERHGEREQTGAAELPLVPDGKSLSSSAAQSGARRDASMPTSKRSIGAVISSARGARSMWRYDGHC